MIDTGTLRESICKTFCGDLAVKTLPSGITVTTSFRDAVSDPISCFIESDGDGWYMADDGHFLDTIARGVDIERGSRKDFLDRILTSVGARCDLRSLEIRTQSKPIVPEPDEILQFITALMRVRDVTFWSRERVKSTFKDDAYHALQVRFTERAEILRSSPIDNSLQEFPADVVVLPKQQDGRHRPTTAVFLVQALDTMNDALMLWMEARDQHRSDIRVTALVEDGSFNLSSNKAQRAFNRIDATAIFRGDEKAAIDRIERDAWFEAA